MTDENWDALVNPFEFKLRTRELTHGFFTDHATKLEARHASDPVLGELWALTRPVWEAWQRDYRAWRLTAGLHRTATYELMLWRRELLVSPRVGGRSRLDEWESAVRGLWAPESEEYAGLFPRGRTGIGQAGLDEIAPELLRIATRLTAMLPELTTRRDALRTTAQSYTQTGQPVPAPLQEQLDTAEWRVDASPGIAGRMQRFAEKFAQLRSTQQGHEGGLARAAFELKATHRAAHWRLFANLGRLIDWAITTTTGGPVQIQRAAGLFDLKMLPKRKAQKPAPQKAMNRNDPTDGEPG